jgi:hypothetical protein
MCIDVIHDAKEQCVMHLISTTKKSIVLDWMFYKIISHNLAVADFALSSYIWATTQEGSPMLPSCPLLQIWYLQHQTQYQLQLHLPMLGQSHQAILVTIVPFCCNHKMIKEDKDHKNK